MTNPIKSFIVKVKQRESVFYKALYDLTKSILYLHIPVNLITKPIFSVVYHAHVLFRESIYWLARFFYVEPIFKSRCAKVGKMLVVDKLPFIIGMGDILLGDGVVLSGKPMFFFNDKVFTNPAIVIGNNTFIGHESCFTVANKIEIGNHCLLSVGVVISDNDGHPIDWERRIRGLSVSKNDVKPVKIGNNVWIGNGATILKGVTIGDRAIIGARSVVTKDVPGDCVAAGNPAVIVKKLTEK